MTPAAMSPLVQTFLFSSAAVMIAAMLWQLWIGGVFLAGFELRRGKQLGAGFAAAQFNNPPGVDIWCGKAYRVTNSSFDPGGWLNPPNATSSTPLLNFQAYPRFNLYLSSEGNGSLIIDTSVQYVVGTPYKNQTFKSSANAPKPFVELAVTVTNSLNGALLAYAPKVPVNATGVEIPFNFSSMPPRSDIPYPVQITGFSPDGLQDYSAVTHVTVLPPRNDTGSVVRIDNLNGGIEVQSPTLTQNEWKPIFPYSFYTSWDWISSTITDGMNATKTLRDFRKEGFNIIHPVPPGGNDPFDPVIFSQFLDLCDSIELYVMYDMRHTYQNNSAMAVQLARLQSHPSLLLYYTADEPDGNSDPLDATYNAYQFLKQTDPYHPVSLVLNCANFYFDEYTRGADIILEDVYPLAVNTSFSTVYNTVCNATYGCCGCDDCHAGDPAFPEYEKNTFLDITTRYKDFERYQTWLTGTTRKAQAKKPVWGVPQAFWDNGSFWQRWPTADESAVMSLLRLNHGAKGIVSWIYPTSNVIETEDGQLATLLASADVTRFTLGTRPTPLKVYTQVGNQTGEAARELLDVAAWYVGNEALVSIVYQSGAWSPGPAYIDLGRNATTQVEVLWGMQDWEAGQGTLAYSDLSDLRTWVLRVSFTAEECED